MTSPPSSSPPADAPQVVSRSKGEKAILTSLMISTLLVSIGFVLATVLGGYGFPATFVGFLMGAFTGTLAYTFFGPIDGAVFGLGPLRLTGIAAVIIGVTLGIKGPLGDDLKDARAIQRGMRAEARIEEAERNADEARTAQRALETRLAQLEQEKGDVQISSTTAVLSRIRLSRANDPLGRGLLEMFRLGQGPFNPVLDTLRVPVRFNETVRPGSFRYCHSRRPEFHERPIRFEVVNREAGTSTVITLEAGSDIGQGICSDIQFELMLGCDAVAALLPGMTAGCGPRGGVEWLPPSTNRNYEVVATILNPDILPRSAVSVRN